MAKIHLIVEGQTVGELAGPIPSGGLQVTNELSEQDAIRMLTMMAHDAGLPGNPTPQEIIDAHWAAYQSEIIQRIKHFEQEEAAKAAANAITEIQIT